MIGRAPSPCTVALSHGARRVLGLTVGKPGPTVPAVSAILVVDDSKVMRDMVVACLRAISGTNFTHASTGLEAIERLSLAQFDLMVLDLNMPDVGGIEVVEFVRAQDRLRSLPVLIVTTRGDDESRERVLRAGATAFLAKPFTPDAIIAEVRRLLPEPAESRA
jgi:two-component system, chemotaxis family, chemotaxis protein CheY